MLRIGIQKSGRIADKTLWLLKEIGLTIEKHSDRQLYTRVSNFPLEILFLRNKDIPKYIEEGVCDMGITGSDTVIESGASVDVVKNLGFGQCHLSIAIPKGSTIERIADLDKKRIATSFPRMTKSFLEQHGLSAEIVEMNGSVELAPSLDVADAISDLVSSGTTLKSNGLKEMFTVFESEVVLAKNAQINDSQKLKDIQILLTRIQSVIDGQKMQYIMMNAHTKDLENIKKALPSMDSPTVLSLASSELIAVHSCIPKSTMWDTVENLKKAGAFSILVLPVENVF